MKRLLLAVALLISGLVGTSAFAQTTVSRSFDVNINLTSACSVSAVSAVSFTYVSGQAGAATSTGGDFTVTCTPGAPYTFAFEHPVGTPTASPVTETDNAVNLQYTLTLPVGGGGTGTGVGQNFQITGSMPGLQAGTCGGGSCTNAAATNKTFALLVTY